MEKDEDLLVAYYQGASGNINWQAKVSGSGKYFTYLQMGTAFGQKALEAASLDKMTKINAGKIKAERAIYSVKAKKDTEQRIADAKTVRDGGYTSELLSKYNFSHEYEVDAVLMRVGHGETIPIYLGAISFGDLSFVSVPYEMYDSNGMFVKDNSPTKMTFVLTCAGGAYAYVPSTFSSKNGGYDAYKTNFEYGTGDEVAAELVEMLKGLK